jgi:hypothetical protein
VTGGPERDSESKVDTRAAALIGLIVVLALAIVAVVLIRELRRQAAIEDCLMARRTNCTPIDVPAR